MLKKYPSEIGRCYREHDIVHEQQATTFSNANANAGLTPGSTTCARCYRVSQKDRRNRPIGHAGTTKSCIREARRA